MSHIASRVPWERLGGYLLLAAALLTGCQRASAPTQDAGPAPTLAQPPVAAPVGVVETLLVEPFDRLDPARWNEVKVKGKTEYTVVDMDGGRVLKADSRHGASILLTPLRLQAGDDLWLTWRWRVDRPVAREGLPWQKLSVDYVWSDRLPAGTVLRSPFSKDSQMIVADGGAEHHGQWRTVRRNLRADYLRCFGKEPPDVVALGLMTDTDTNGGQALAFYDDVTLTREPAPDAPPAASVP